MTRYVAFLSYSHRNRAETEWLHRSLESFRIPAKLVGRETSVGVVPKRLIPIFRDRDELGAADDLGVQLRAALENSGHLIVIASPAAARSKWVNEEILSYKRTHGEGRVLALIVDGEPWASGIAGREEEEAFPAALRYRIGADGELSDQLAEPIAADIRPAGDGRKLGLMKLIAGLTGLRLDDLVQREAQRRARRMTFIATGSAVGMVLTSGLAFYANDQRIAAVQQRKIAERETAAARAATDYLIGTFELSNPATENPRTVSLVTILSRSAERARQELKEQPEIEARLVTAVGRAYNNLGLLDEAEQALARALPAINRAGPEGASAMVTLAQTQLKRGDIDDATRAVEKASMLLGSDRQANLVARARVEQMRGLINTAKSNMPDAIAHYDQALVYLAADPASDPRERATILNGRGVVLSDSGRFEEAEASLQQANGLFRRYRGEGHLETGRSWFALALNAYLAGNLEQAEVRILKSLAILSKMLDRTNPIRADALSLKGQIFQGQGRLAEADKALNEAVQVYQDTLGERHFLIGIAEVYRAMIASDRGLTSEALRHLDIAKLNYDASYSELHPNHGDLLVNRAVILAKAGRQREAQADCKEGISILNKTLGPEHAGTIGLKKTCETLKANEVKGKA